MPKTSIASNQSPRYFNHQRKTNGNPFASRYHNQQYLSILNNSQDPRHHTYAQRVKDCGRIWSVTDENTGEVHEQVNNCRLRFCVHCQQERQYKEVRIFKQWLPKLLEAEHLDFIFLTLGFKPVFVESTNLELTQINKSLRMLTRKENQKWPAVGHIISREFKIYDQTRIRFDVHIILALKHNPFKTNGCLNVRYWISEIHKRFGTSEIHVAVCPIPKDPSDSLEDSLNKTFSYIIKPKNYLGTDETTLALIDRLHEKKLVSTAGIFRLYKHKFKTDRIQK